MSECQFCGKENEKVDTYSASATGMADYPRGLKFDAHEECLVEASNRGEN